MKKVIFYLFLAGLWTACDIIDKPFKNALTIDWTGLSYGDTLKQTDRAVFIEDFTGHTCKNCPKATKVLMRLDTLYGTRVVPLAIHALATGFSGVSSDYPTDFTTAEGGELYLFFGPPIGIPNGMVQRSGFPGNNWKSYNAWQSLAATELSKPTSALFTLIPGYHVSDRHAVLKYTVSKVLASAHEIKVAFYLTESGIVSPQLMPDGTRNPTYVHNHILRAAPLSVLGKLALTSTAVVGESHSNFVTYALPTEWNEEKMDWIAIAYDAVTYEVLQAAVLPVR